jgi:hypothetical protein
MNMQRLKHWGQVALITVVVIGVFAGGSVQAKVYEKSQDSRSSHNSAEGKNGQTESKKGDTNFISAGATLVADQIVDINKPWWKKGWDLTKDYTRLVGAYIGDKAKQVWDAGVTAAKWTGDKIVSGAKWTWNQIVDDYRFVKRKAIQGYNFAKKEAIATYNVVKKVAKFSVSLFRGVKIGKDSYSLPNSHEEYLLENKKIDQLLSNPALSKEQRYDLSLLRQRKKDLELAYMAKDVYDDSNPQAKDLAVMGWKRLNDDEVRDLGLSAQALHPSDSDFRSAIYRNTDTGLYVVAFKGTDPTSIEDWLTDILQSINIPTPHYQRAIGIADKVREKNINVVFTGHSLGGGLASTACLEISADCELFNPSGVSLGTKILTKNKRAGVVRKVEVSGELLNTFQDVILGIPDSIGKESDVLPLNKNGEMTVQDSLNIIGSHMQEKAIRGIKKDIGDLEYGY